MTKMQHPLFQQFPLNGTATIATGAVPTPYQIYDGYGAFVAGTAELAAVQRLLQPETVIPLHNRDGRAFMGIWLCDFTDASLGPHHELQFSIFVSRQPLPPLGTQPLSLLATMLTNPTIEMLCHGLWNNTPTVVAYNRELLSLNAKLARSQLSRAPQQMGGEVSDAASSAPILTARLGKPGRASLRATLALAGQLGWRKTIQVNQQPWVEMKVVNPVGVSLPRNAVAQAMTKNATNTLRYFEPANDRLTIHQSPYSALDFRPQVVQHMNGFKFVYLHPL